MKSHANIIQLIQRSVERHGSNNCFHHKDLTSGQWKQKSWDEMWEQVNAWARGLISLKVAAGDRVAIISETRMEWTLADLAILTVGGIVVPIYPTLTHKQVERIIKDSGATLAFVENRKHYDRIHEISPEMTIIPFDHKGAWGEEVSLRRLQKSGRAVSPSAVDSRIKSISLDDDATYVYTSGTTGQQKGVVLSHRNIVAEVDATRSVLQLSPDKIGMVCLPLPHVLARAVQFYQLAQGCQAAYCESVEYLARNLQEVRPHFITGVPRMLEKMHARIYTSAQALPAWRNLLFHWAVKVGLNSEELQHHKQTITLFDKISLFIAKSMVFRKVLGRMGGRLSVFICGGAPLAKPMGKFFKAIGLSVLEGYGLTETFAAITLNSNENYHFGTVGKPLPGVQLKLGSDNEILVKGEMVFDRYLNLPEATAEVFDEAGWFRTGDLGEYSKEGFLRITGRKKEIIITAGGKNIAPVPIEEALSQSKYVDMAMVYGDEKKYLTALLVLNRDAIINYAGKEHIAWKSFEDLAFHQTVYKLLLAEVKKVNSALAKYETIKKFAIIENAFSIESGELTPTLKLRRNKVGENYKETLAALY